MSSNVTRALKILEVLATEALPMNLDSLAEKAEISPAVAHKLLKLLEASDYVENTARRGTYKLSLRMPSLGIRYMSTLGIGDISQPIIERLAKDIGEFVVFGVGSQNGPVWITKAQGGKTGLRYDQQLGIAAPLTSTATGLAWLSRIPEEEAIRLALENNALKQGLDGAPSSVPELIECLAKVRKQNWAVAADTHEMGVTSVATAFPIARGSAMIATLTIGGPSVRLSPRTISTLTGKLLAVGAEIAATYSSVAAA